MLYLNQAGTSWPKPRAVQDAVRDALCAPVETWADRLTHDHAEVCRAFGVRNEERMLLTPGATSALSVGILDHPWQSGDRILVSGLEHHALHRPARQLSERGVELEVIGPGDGRALAGGSLQESLRRGGVRLVAMTAACNVTGDLLPLTEIVSVAHEHGALVLVDAAQVAGWLPLDVAALGVDLLAFAGHKGPQGPWGIGGLYVAETVEMASPAAACELPVAGAPPRAPMPGYCDVGSVDRAALAGLAAGLRWLAAPEQSDRLDRARRQAAAVQQALQQIAGVVCHGFDPPAARLPVVAFTAESRSPTELASALWDHGIVASGGLQCAPLAHETLGTAPDGVLRLSFGPGNDDGDEERAVAALCEILG